MSGAGIKFDEKLQKERENFIQLLFTVQGPCTFCLEKTLFKYVIDLGTTLDIFLHSKRQAILFWRIGQQRKNDFFPQNGSDTDLETWDVQMYWLILTKILQNVTPTQKNDIENVKDIRNKLCHLSNPKLNEGDFNLYHRQITTFIDEIVKLISDEAFKTKVKCGLKEIETLLQQTVFNLVKTVHRFYQGETTLLEEVHATVNHVSANQFPEIKNMFLEVKELISSHFPRNELKQMKAPEESSVTMKIKNVSVNEEEDLSLGLVDLFMKEIRSTERGDAPMQNYLSKALQRALKIFEQYGTLTKVRPGSVVFYTQFDSFLSFIDCYDDVLAGKLTTELKPLEKELQSLLQRPSLELELIINTNEIQHFLLHSLQLLKQLDAGLDVDHDATSNKEIERMRHGLSTEQMRTRPVTVESREPDYRDSKKSKHMLKVYTASTLVLPRERQSNLGNDTNAQSAFPAMVLTEEEQLMFREDELYPHITTLINETNRRKGEEIEARNMEMIQLLERVRGQEKELLIARVNETKLQEKLMKWEMECTELMMECTALRDDETKLQEKITTLDKECTKLRMECTELRSRDDQLNVLKEKFQRSRDKLPEQMQRNEVAQRRLTSSINLDDDAESSPENTRFRDDYAESSPENSQFRPMVNPDGTAKECRLS